MESTPTVKDAHSPAGQPFYAPKSFADLLDCPICKYGTPRKTKDKMRCIDCGAILEEDYVKAYNQGRKQ